MYVVAVCYKCGRYFLATESQKTKMCPYCSARLSMIKTKRVARVRTAQEASEVIRSLKQNGFVGRKGR